MSVSNLSPGEPFGFDLHWAERREATPGGTGHIALSKWVMILAICDTAGSIGLAALAFKFAQGYALHDAAQLWAGILGFMVAWAIAAQTQSLYDRRIVLSDARNHCVTGAITCCFAIGIILLLGFATQWMGAVSRLWFLSWTMSVFVWVCGLRVVWSRYWDTMLQKGGCFDRALVLAGSPFIARCVADEVRRESGGRVGIHSAAGIPGTPGGQSLDWIEQIVREGAVDRVIIADFEAASDQTQLVVEHLRRLAVDVSVIPNAGGLKGRAVNVDRIGGLPTIDLSSRPLSVVQLTLKRTEDLVLGALILVLTLPVFVMIAIAIKLDSRGPVFFFQPREGFHGSVFRLWKFRTMYQNHTDLGSVKQTSKDDPRVTRVGRILRRLSLDELPQVFNVLMGSMSIVGPRPHALGMTAVGRPMQQVIAEYSARHRLKPGITGLAQISGCRGEIDSEQKLRQRVSLDCHYIDNWSLFFDLWIVFRTAAIVLFDRTAY